VRAVQVEGKIPRKELSGSRGFRLKGKDQKARVENMFLAQGNPGTPERRFTGGGKRGRSVSWEQKPWNLAS